MPNSSAERLRDELRFAHDPLVQRRRGIVALSLFSAAILGGVSLFQMGVIRRLPGSHGKHFDSDAVHGSVEAYARLKTPDALLGLFSYSCTACLAGMGARDRWRSEPWIPLAMGAKALSDATMAATLGLAQATKLRKYSVWSLMVSAATLGSLILATPEAKRALFGPKG